MSSEEDPRVVDLNRYRRAAAERTRASSRPQPKPRPQAGRPGDRGGQQFLGRNRFALPILVGLIVLAVVLTFGPALLR